jgi:polar amino acid transport system substrate-binding protein
MRRNLSKTTSAASRLTQLASLAPWALTLALAAPASAASATAKDEALAKVKASGELVVALDPTYPPMETQEDGGAFVGFDVDLAHALAARLGVKAKLMAMSWDGILAGLSADRYDIILSSMNVTPERAKEVDFVEYLRMSQVFVAKPGSRVASESDLVGKVVAVAADTTSYDWVAGKKAAGLKIKDVRAYRMSSEVFLALRSGHADVVVVDEPVGRWFALQDPKSLAVTGRAVAPEPLGIAVRKGETSLKTALAEAVAAMEKDGAMAKLASKWFGAAVPEAAKSH